jgi:TolB-like protein
MTEQPSPKNQQASLKKKKDRIRSAWISFTGRIVAQLVGAAATVVLGVIVLHKAQASTRTTAELARAEGTPQARAAVEDRNDSAAVAVLSFQNYSGDARQDAFADALTETIISKLAQVDTLHVVSRTSSSQYKGQQRALPDIARELGAVWIIEGSVTRAAGRVRVVAQLIDARTDRHVWARSYERVVRDPLAAQNELADAITRDVQETLGSQPQLLATSPVAVTEPSH